MSRNLTTSSCPECGYTVRLSDLRGKPIEFRRYSIYAPQIGCRFDCSCGAVYFVMWHAKDNFWGVQSINDGSWKDPVSRHNGQEFPNKEAGRFAVEREGWKGKPEVHQTGYYVIDLSYWTTFNDEQESADLVRMSIEAGNVPPAHLCLDDALDTQWEW